MKRKRVIAAITAAVLCVAMLATCAITFTLGYADSFYSSFEDNEKNAFLANTADKDGSGNARVQGLGYPLTDASGTIADFTASVTATEQTTGHNGSTAASLKDSNSSTKYITAVGNSKAYIIYTLNQPYVLQKYTITTANDTATYGRHPKDWTLYGSNDKSTWIPLDRQTNQSYVANFHVSTYNIKNSTPFLYYKLDITKNDGQNMIQIADWNLYGFTSLVGDFTSDVVKVEGTASRNNREVIGNLSDSSSGTKYLVDGGSATITYTLSKAQAMASYSLTSANDEPTRDPKAWTLQGSNDNAQWATLDTRSEITFADRYETKIFTTANTAAYKYYKLSITANNGAGMMQLADWNLASNQAGTAGLFTTLSSGPKGSYSNFSDRGWTGAKALAIRSSQTDENAYGYNVIYKDVDLYVGKNTQLSYMIYPDYVGSDKVADYDTEYTSHHISVDLKFTDGTYLSNLNAADQNGDIVAPDAQGQSHALYTKQWNQIKTKIGQVAKGKVIDQILIAFKKDEKKAHDSLGVLAYIDDIKIETAEKKVRKNQLSYTMTRRGSQSSSSFSRGLTFPGTTYPNGFNFWSMSTNEKWGKSADGTFFNYQPGNDITHFTITHQANYWIGDWGTFQFMPYTAENLSSATEAPTAAQRKSDYNRDTLVDQANYLKVDFADGTKAAGTTVELVPTNHGASIKFSFDKNVNKNIIFDSVNATANCQFTFNADGSFQGRTTHTGTGMVSGAPYMYFYGTFSKTPAATKVISASSADAIATFSDTEVVMNLATSFISADQAKHNLELEIGDKSFKKVYKETEAAWLDIMDRIEIEGGTEEQLTTFWSAIYRAYMYPNTMAENQGTNEAPKPVYASPYSADPAAPEIKEGNLYYNNGFWDTARTTPGVYPLLTPTAYGEYLDGFIEHYKESGWIGRWIAPNAINSMVGTHSDAMIADAYLRGIEFDYESGLESALRNASGYSSNVIYGREMTETSNYVGYVNNSLRQGMSWSLESYLNDAAIAKLAQKLGDKDIATYYGNRALYYTKLFNDEVGFFMGKDASGNWSTDASSYNPRIWNADYTETNGWNYAFSVPYDGQGLANLYGGKKQLEEKLDEFLSTDSQIVLGGERPTSDRTIHEMLEQREVRLGEYAHSNQPSHHALFMYNYANAPEKTQYYTRDILDRLYVGSSIGQGMVGDEDNGESSSWFIQASMGIFAANVGSGNYTFTAPLFDKVTLHLENGNDLVIKANNNSDENVYIQSLTIDGKAYNSTVISHQEFINAKEIVFEMGNTPSEWGKTEDSLDSITTGKEIATPMEDLMPSTVATSLPAANASGNAVYSTTDVKWMVDNTNYSYTGINSKNASVYAYFEKGAVIEMYTISTYENITNMPTTAALYGSNNGNDWTKLDEHKNITFKWQRYVEPFAVDNDASYKYYRLDLSTTASSMIIGELELYGYPYAGANQEALSKLITEAKAIDQSKYGTALTSFNEAIAKAEEIHANSNATVKEIYQAMTALQDEMKAIAPSDGTAKIEAEKCTAYSNLVLDVNAARSGGGNLGGVKPNSYASYNFLDFGSGVSKIKINYSRKNGADNGVVQSPDATVKIYIDALPADGGTLVGTISEPAYTATTWGTYLDLSTNLSSNITGIHTVYLVFEGTGPCVINLDYFQFS